MATSAAGLGAMGWVQNRDRSSYIFPTPHTSSSFEACGHLIRFSRLPQTW